MLSVTTDAEGVRRDNPQLKLSGLDGEEDEVVPSDDRVPARPVQLREGLARLLGTHREPEGSSGDQVGAGNGPGLPQRTVQVALEPCEAQALERNFGPKNCENCVGCTVAGELSQKRPPPPSHQFCSVSSE